MAKKTNSITKSYTCLENIYDRKGYSLRDKIFFYRTIRKHIFIIMSLIIIVLLLLNYYNLAHFNDCNHQLNDKFNNDIELNGNSNDYNNTSIVSAVRVDPANTEVSDEPKKFSFQIPDFLVNLNHLKAKGRTLFPR